MMAVEGEITLLRGVATGLIEVAARLRSFAVDMDRVAVTAYRRTGQQEVRQTVSLLAAACLSHAADYERSARWCEAMAEVWQEEMRQAKAAATGSTTVSWGRPGAISPARGELPAPPPSLRATAATTDQDQAQRVAALHAVLDQAHAQVTGVYAYESWRALGYLDWEAYLAAEVLPRLVRSPVGRLVQPALCADRGREVS